jgi:hypothetical protein
MTRTRKAELLLAVLFISVGIAASINTLRFNAYKDTAIRRDTAQEQCQRDTLAALTLWAQSRTASGDAYDDVDTAQAMIIEAQRDGRPVTPDMQQRLLTAIHTAQLARAATTDALRQHPLPACRP